MLVLGRDVSEKVMIGDNICIHVVSVNGKNVHLGFEAPKEVVIHRMEIYEKVKAESKEVSIAGNLVTKKAPAKIKSRVQLLKLHK